MDLFFLSLSFESCLVLSINLIHCGNEFREALQGRCTGVTGHTAGHVPAGILAPLPRRGCAVCVRCDSLVAWLAAP